MKAVIMAGGFGTRLRPITCNIPKPVVPLANRPIMEHIIELLKRYGFVDLAAILYHQPEIITEYFRDGVEFGVKMSYVRAESDLGTAGSVKKAVKLLNERFLIISGDLLTNFNLSEIIDYHIKKKALATMVLTRVENPLQYGVVITEKNGKISRFLEKPSWGEVFSDTINTGIYVLEPQALNYIPDDQEFDFSKNLFPLFLEKGLPLYGYVASGYWKDIGNLSEYRLAHSDVLNGKITLNIHGRKIEDKNKNLWIGEETNIDPQAILEGSIIIGKNCTIKKNVRISGSVIGDNCVLDEDADIKDCVLWDNIYVGPSAKILDSVICKGVDVGADAQVEKNVVVSEECVLGRGSLIKQDVKIWPYKTIEDGATLCTSLIWGDKWSRALFGEYGIVGLANIEITPEFAAKLGAAYGATLDKGATILSSRDIHKTSRIIHRAIMCGLLSSGVNIVDFGITPIPVAHYVSRPLGTCGGIHIRRSPYNSQVIDIKFFDENGMDLSSSRERSIESLFFREDFRRAQIEETGEISFPSRAMELYRDGFLNFANVKEIQNAKFKIVVDYAYGPAATIFPSLLGKFSCEVVALNSHMDASKLTKTAEEFDHSLKQLSNIVGTLKADAGFLMDAGGEKIFMVDELGKVVSGDDALGLIVSLVLSSNPFSTIAVPVTASRNIEEIAKKNGSIVLRTRTTYRSMMDTAQKKDVIFVGENKGGYIFSKFNTTFDAMMSIAKLLEFLAKHKVKISTVLKKLPKSVIIREHISCPWELKGTIMRNLIEATKSHKVDLIDGVKVYHNRDWVIIVPDQEMPLLHINAEASDEQKARTLVNKYIEQIKKWQK
ncbi:MAG: mannose-1-phosphate guanyltransferase [Candidatus Firestonebacteria bacterium]